jgi:hypothetical protein
MSQPPQAQTGHERLLSEGAGAAPHAWPWTPNSREGKSVLLPVPHSAPHDYGGDNGTGTYMPPTVE